MRGATSTESIWALVINFNVRESHGWRARAPFWQNAAMSMRIVSILVCLAGAPLAAVASAPGTYLEPAAFIGRVFGQPPDASVLWLNDALRESLAQVLGHPPRTLRIRYWAQADRTAWILDEIGKDKPITLGVVVGSGAIESLDVLVFRESRGWEIRHAFFTDQFRDARLDARNHLQPQVDGITGATLSVRAATRVAAAALLLHEHVSEPSN